MPKKVITITPPSEKEKISLRLMIFTGLLSVVFFLGSMLQQNNISYLPLYMMLMITLVYYAGKYLHEWYHYFSITAPEKKPPVNNYTVDILTTYCAGEPFEMLEATLVAIREISYPHTAWCCDEADDPRVKALCTRLGVTHVTRTVKKDAKAGNINNALQYARGEICVVLDPDHVPLPGFLDEVLGHFDDPAVGFVQVVQAYSNQAESLVARGAAQQTYQFYGPVMMSMHSYGTVQAIGANCSFRRAALDSIGGHASGLAEDMHTAMQLHAAGWRSVYVPAIITRGLVPATMSSYYKQQLKWSRGTWELFVTAFPRLFRKFTWQQKLHYFTLPFHYLSGLVFLINFLIPVISLFTGYIPLQMDVYSFLLASLPMICMGLFIRHYVQKWVAEETDRGFHLVGGILQIGTWWIHTVGFVYTLLRKRVPYIPTPKNDSDPLPFVLVLPNLLVAVISLVAIVYGFLNDYTPYTVFMAGLAFMQVVFMVFIFSISGFVHDDSKLNNIATNLKKRNGFIILAHGFLRKYSVPLSIVTVVAFFISFWQMQQLPAYLPAPLAGRQVFYRGVMGNEVNNLSNLVRSNQLAIVAMEIPWNSHENAGLDTPAINAVYRAGAIPLLVWKLAEKDSMGTGFHLNNARQDVLQGRYNNAINSFARQVAALQQPVFLCYDTGSPGDSSFPGAQTGDPAEYIAAWQYVHQLFDSAGAGKVIWIWTAGDAKNAAAFFPGKNYADWLGIQLRCSYLSEVQNTLPGFDAVYRPFHRKPLFVGSGLPVMAMVPGNCNASGAAWWNDTWQIIDTGFNEIKSVVLTGNTGEQEIKTAFATAGFSPLPVLNGFSAGALLPQAPAKKYPLPQAVKSVVYDKGYYWFRNRHTLHLRNIEEDVAMMKMAGINTIERRMPGFYDGNIETVLAQNKIGLIPHFWLMATPGIIASEKEMNAKKEEILGLVKKNLYRKNVLAWNMGSDVLYLLANQEFKPAFYYYQEKYVAWLQEVCKAVRQLDTLRPIIMDLHWDEGGMQRFRYYKKYIPDINWYMLEADAKFKEGLRLPLQQGMAWGKIDPALWPLQPATTQSATIPAWQDAENTHFVSMNGLLDLEGRKKENFALVQNTWGRQAAKGSALPAVKILRPAQLTSTGLVLNYQLVYQQNNGRWKSFYNDSTSLRFVWYLVRTDQFGNTMFIKKVGEGPALGLEVPESPQYYQLFAECIAGDEVKMVSTSLNTPLE